MTLFSKINVFLNNYLHDTYYQYITKDGKIYNILHIPQSYAIMAIIKEVKFVIHSDAHGDIDKL